MPAWWAWAFWLDPFSYAIQGLISNEFSAPRWQHPYNEFSSKRRRITLGQACLQVPARDTRPPPPRILASCAWRCVYD